MSKIDQKIEELTNEIKELRKMFARGTRDNVTKPNMQIKGADVVLKDIATHPGTVRKEIAERVKLAPQEITKIVGELQVQDKLVKVGERRTTRWFTPESLQQLARAASATK